MPEYVDKEFVIEKLDELICLASAGVPIKPIRIEGTEKLILMEKADVAPVVHGRWIGEEICIETGDISATLRECSQCHRIRPVDEYCSHCGAKMVTSND